MIDFVYLQVKGNVSVGGLNVQKWDSDLLRSRLGVILADVCSTSNAAKLYSGLSLEEILDPTNGGGGNNAVGAYHRGHDSKKEKDAIMVALKVRRRTCNVPFTPFLFGMSKVLI